MSLTSFLEYAEAFERAYASEDWQSLSEHFTEDVVYEIHAHDGEPEEIRGRAAVLTYLQRLTSTFDKRFASRRLVPFTPPREAGGSVWLHGAAVYTMADGERCHLVMEERADFSQGRIRRLVDFITPGGRAEVRAIRQRYPQVFAEMPVPAQ